MRLSEDVLRKARIVAAERGTSISGLVAECIERLVRDRDEYETAKQRALALLERGFPLGGKRFRRDELYDRPILKGRRGE